MATKREIVELAFEELGMGVYNFDPSPDEYQAALRRLDRLAAQWDGIGIRVGYYLPATPADSDLDQNAGIPDTAVMAFASNLAINMASTIGKTVQPGTFKTAKDGYNALLIARGAPPQVQYQSTMPIGQGNKPLASDRQYFVPEDRLSTGDDVFEY